ncbi:MAG: hypothetical protein ACOY0T_19010 [Myxococcota bacterium]
MSFHLEAFAGATTSLATDQLATPTFGLALDYRRTLLRVGFRISFASGSLDATPSATSVSVATPTTLHLRRWLVNADVCTGGPIPSTTSRWHAFLCTSIGPATWSASADDLTSSTAQHTNQWLIAFALRAEYELTRRWNLTAAPQLEKPLTRLHWTATDPRRDTPVSLHQTPTWAATLSIGIAYSF